jgi:sugar phosphate isomerase/epimerase
VNRAAARPPGEFKRTSSKGIEGKATMTMNSNTGAQDRRSFLKELAVSSGAVMLAGRVEELMAAQIDPKWKNQIGIELFTLRDALNKDYEGSLAKLAKIGYKEVEPADPYNNMEPKQYRALLDKYGLKMYSTHSGATDGAGLEKELEGQALMGIKYTDVRAGGGMMPGGAPGGGGDRGAAGAAGRGGDRSGGGAPGAGGPPGAGGDRSGGGAPGADPARGARGAMPQMPKQTLETVKKSAAEMNKYGKIVKKFGMKILIHNHASEFDLLQDSKLTQYDVLLAETDPELVVMQIDIGWAAVAGQNVLEMFKKNPGRYELWHVKDAKFKDLDPKATPSERQFSAKITAIGEGDVDYRMIFANAKLAGLKYFVIEQDTAGEGGRDVFEDCRIACENLHKILS